MSKEKLIIGVDNGNANTKTAHTSFVSGINTHDLRPPMVDEILEYNGKYYTLSNQRNIYTRNKTSNNDCFVLTLFAIAKEILYQNKYTDERIDIYLSTGLPPEHYSLLKDEFRDYFLKDGNKIDFIYNDKSFKINILDVLVFPQAFSAIITKASTLKNYSRTFVIDLGGFTVDAFLLANGKPDMSYCRSLEIGIITMCNKIKRRVNVAFDMSIEDEHIIDVLSGKPTVLSEDVKKLIFEEARKHTENILNTLREQGVDLKANPAIFAGGGAMLLKPFFEESTKTGMTEFILDVSANAAGYAILADGQLRRAKHE